MFLALIACGVASLGVAVVARNKPKLSTLPFSVD